MQNGTVTNIEVVGINGMVDETAYNPDGTVSSTDLNGLVKNRGYDTAASSSAYISGYGGDFMGQAARAMLLYNLLSQSDLIGQLGIMAPGMNQTIGAMAAPYALAPATYGCATIGIGNCVWAGMVGIQVANETAAYFTGDKGPNEVLQRTGTAARPGCCTEVPGQTPHY